VIARATIELSFMQIALESIEPQPRTTIYEEETDDTRYAKTG
jgi:hypothetical protein